MPPEKEFSCEIDKIWIVDSKDDKYEVPIKYKWNGETCIITQELELKENEMSVNEFLYENNIEVDENGNVEMYIVEDVGDDDYEVGTKYNRDREVECYNLYGAYEDIKETWYSGGFTINPSVSITPINNWELEFPKAIEENKTDKICLKDRLLKIKDRILKISLNKKDAFIRNKNLYVGKYKILEEVELKPEIKFEVTSFDEEYCYVKLYNSLTLKSENIKIDSNIIDDALSLKCAISDYLENDKFETDLMNKTRGMTL